jgi:hypothetical protein
VVAAFQDAVEFVFGAGAPEVVDSIADFIRSMPLALRWRVRRAGTDILCAHSVPSPELMDRFDPAVLERDLNEDDYVPRRGAAHLMVWGRDHTEAQLAELGARWGVGLFILGHEHAPDGARVIAPNAVVLNSDHDNGVYLEIGEGTELDARSAAGAAMPLRVG